MRPHSVFTCWPQWPQWLLRAHYFSFLFETWNLRFTFPSSSVTQLRSTPVCAWLKENFSIGLSPLGIFSILYLCPLRFLQVLPPEVNSCTCIRSYYITGKYFHHQVQHHKDFFCRFRVKIVEWNQPEAHGLQLWERSVHIEGPGGEAERREGVSQVPRSLSQEVGP